MQLTKQGPKRRRRTRRDFGNGQVRRWGSTTIHFKQTREAKLARAQESNR